MPATLAPEVAAQIAELERLAPHLSAKDQNFAAGLIYSTKTYGITSGRGHWIATLIERAQAGAPATGQEQPASKVGSFAKVMALFDLAKENLKKPKIRLQLRSGAPLVLGVATSKAKFPGTVDVTDGGSYGLSKWYGRVAQDGAFTESAKHQEAMPEIRGLLTRLGEAPAQVAAEYGRLTGRCCFCNLKLSDPRSTAVGYGATCAKHYGLLDHWKESDALLQTREARQLAEA